MVAGVICPHPKPSPRPKKLRKPLARSKPIERKARLKTKTPIKARNPERLARLRAEQFPDPPAVTPWCLIAERLAEYQRRHGAKMIPAGWSRCWGRIDPAHVRTRGAGGKADDVVYLCRGHHREQEGRTAVFDERYGVDLAAEAARLAAERRGLTDGP